ncbi:putative secreted RxLR effector protein [Phytophthora cinnamomi]|uniref:putative secreted RxLR effector protein n=1 Tax=Phytophthora cinnamomi TaxID=4785 RepID=UPI00355AA96F|nr:putative secreted RxLR effector protein [Phytophthora cinnamomi]
MRFLSVALLLLIATVLLTNGDAVARKLESTSGDLVSGAEYQEPAVLRLLRDDDSEERALPVPAPSVALFTKWVKSLGSKITDNVQARYWLWRKRSADDIFKRLKLDGGLDTLFSNPKLKTLNTYIALLNKKNPDKTVSLAGLISKSYGDLALARKIEYALNDPSQKRMAAMLAFQQRQNWKAAGKTSDEVFKMLQLDKAGYDLFQTPQLNSWYNYVVMANKNDANSVMIATLTARYGDDGLAAIFLAGAKPRVRRMRWVSMKLETAMGQEWVRKGSTSDDLFKLLKLDEDVDKVLTNPALVSWVGYLGRYNTKNSEKQTTMIGTFTKFYGDETLCKLVEARF